MVENIEGSRVGARAGIVVVVSVAKSGDLVVGVTTGEGRAGRRGKTRRGRSVRERR